MSGNPQVPAKPGCPDQLDRIEAKLDALITALAEDDHEEDKHDLEGNPIRRSRNAEDVL